MEDYYIDKETGAVIRSELFERWKTQLKNADCLMLQGMTGMGKTLLVKTFLNRNYPHHLMVSCREDWKPRVLDYIEQMHDGRVRKFIVLDDFQEIVFDREQLAKVLSLFQDKRTGMGHCKFMFLSRGRAPKELTDLLHDRVVYAAADMMLDLEQIRLMMEQNGLVPGEQMVENCFAHSRGWPWFVKVWIQHLCTGMEDADEIHRCTANEIWDEMEVIFRDTVMASMFERLECLSVFDCFTKEMAELLLGETQTKELFRQLNMGMSGVSYHQDGTIWTHRFFLRYLRRAFLKRPREEQKLYCEKAAAFYEEKKEIVQAIRCYCGAGNQKKMTELTIVLAENADSCIFSRDNFQYIDVLPEDAVESSPDLISAKAILVSYRMKMEESEQWKEKLRQYTMKHPDDKAALRCYLRLRIALPSVRAETLPDKLQDCVDAFGWKNAKVHNVMLTGNLPSVINGGIDFTCFLLDENENYFRMKRLAVPVLGAEMEGWTEIFLGEAAYLRDDRMEAIAYLTQGLSSANLSGNLGMQYAAVGIMSRLFLAEGQPDTAASILQNLRVKAADSGLNELLPNIQCSELFCRIRKGDRTAAKDFMYTFWNYDKRQFFISDRYLVYTAAMACILLERNFEALSWLELLQDFSEKYHRSYLLYKVKLLKAVIFWRMGEPWQELVTETVIWLRPYGMIRFAADEGAALLPLWKEIDWDKTDMAEEKSFLDRIKKAMEQCAFLYPGYLGASGELVSLIPREKKILACMAEGQTNDQIAKHMGLSVSTVKKNISSIFTKLGVDNRAGAVKMGYRNELI
ncbi:MAG: LuxR C-terminal-related transcriptional regulator [Lachnospiraceae bacterium]|nr:LuxR C-terminal-related transcriptional regulator [Lachnospiraceae bacterium]